jgi:hypothetical protein
MAPNYGPTLQIVALAATTFMGSQSTAQPKCDPASAAENFVAKQYPSFGPVGKKVVVTEQRDRWIFSYELPTHMLGGVPVVIVDKKTCKVVDAHHTQ